MRPYSAMFERLLSSASATLNTPEKQLGEDTIDWMHRLVQLKMNPVQISELTNVPLRNVLYWYHSNGYGRSTCDLESLGEKR